MSRGSEEGQGSWRLRPKIPLEIVVPEAERLDHMAVRVEDSKAVSHDGWFLQEDTENLTPVPRKLPSPPIGSAAGVKVPTYDHEHVPEGFLPLRAPSCQTGGHASQAPLCDW